MDEIDWMEGKRMQSTRLGLLWKWTLRDIRERWLQVLGLALIIALGVAIFSGVSSITPWRTEAADRSFAMLNMYDLKVQLTAGSYLDAEQWVQTLHSIPHASWIQTVEPRLKFDTTVDASTPDRSIVVSGQIVGVEAADGGPEINQLHVTSGRGFQSGDAGAPVAVVEHNFADYYGLAPGDRTLRVSGGQSLEPVGNALSAEHFYVVQEEAGSFGIYAQDRYAVLFVPLRTAQQMADLPGRANEVLLTVAEGPDEADLDQLQVELQNVMSEAFPDVGASVGKKSENFVYQFMYDEIASNQEVYDTFGAILLLGAGFGAFILIGRIVDAQRREIGINMALGVARWRISQRYLLLGAEIALLGMLLGAALGLIINQALGQVLKDMIPLPYFRATFQAGAFVQGAVIGAIIPFLAVLYPVWRAVRVAPIDAIQTSYLVSRSGGLAPLLARLPLPGSSFTQMPLRNIFRGLRRTVMTVLGLSTAIIILVVILGEVDTLFETMDVGSQELKQDVPNRTQVVFQDFYPLSGALISEIAANDRLAQTIPVIALSGQLNSDRADDGGDSIDVQLQLMDLQNDLWAPTVTQGAVTPRQPGVLVTDKAARDLGVGVGDTLTLRHPYRESEHAWHVVETPVQVMGIHPGILRSTVYMDIRDASVMNLEGLANSLQINPAPGVEVRQLERELSNLQGVALVRQPTETLDAMDSMMEDYMGLFTVFEFIVLVMAFLMAYNTTRSNIDERRRDIATMFAFGTRVRTVLRMAMLENLVIGLMGTAVGLGLGWLTLNAVMLDRIEAIAPDMNIIVSVSSTTYLWAVVIGVIVVAVTPMVLTRRLVKMDIPSTLRVIE
jgi:putative ABC transport system permease protein